MCKYIKSLKTKDERRKFFLKSENLKILKPEKMLKDV